MIGPCVVQATPLIAAETDIERQLRLDRHRHDDRSSRHNQRTHQVTAILQPFVCMHICMIICVMIKAKSLASSESSIINGDHAMVDPLTDVVQLLFSHPSYRLSTIKAIPQVFLASLLWCVVLVARVGANDTNRTVN
jgi:hypothetical protein